MLTFFTILFSILGLNIILMILSLRNSNKNPKKKEGTTPSKVYPIDIISSKYKKAV